MEINAITVKDLREKTGAGMMDCKNALVEAKGDMEEAIVILRKKGLASAAEESDASRRRRHDRTLHSRRVENSAFLSK